jgi:hypothetical protein
MNRLANGGESVAHWRAKGAVQGMNDQGIQRHFDAGNDDRDRRGRIRRDVRPEVPFWSRPGLPTSSLRLAAESFVEEWYGSGFAIGAYSYNASDGPRCGTFTLRGGVFTYEIAYDDAARQYEVRCLDSVW